MSYQVLLKRSAEKELKNLPSSLSDRILTLLIKLRDNPRPVGVMKLQSRHGYRIRAGDYRVLYEIDDRQRIVQIFSVAHRKDVYR